MKRIGIYGKSISDKNLPFLVKLVSSIRKKINADLYFHQNLKCYNQLFLANKSEVIFADHDLIKNPVDLLISFGGDGTFLDTATMIKDSQIPILGINAGRLGFLANITQDDIDQAVLAISTKQYKIDNRTLLQLNNSMELLNKPCQFALNEITLIKKDSSSMLKIHAEINDRFLNTYWADGLIVATPTGSTAYSLSGNGPIMSPEVKAITLLPMFPHSLNARTLITSQDKKIKLKVTGRSKAYLSMDSHMNMGVSSRNDVYIKKANEGLTLIHPTDHSFFSSCRNKLGWSLGVPTKKS